MGFGSGSPGNGGDEGFEFSGGGGGDASNGSIIPGSRATKSFAGGGMVTGTGVQTDSFTAVHPADVPEASATSSGDESFGDRTTTSTNSTTYGTAPPASQALVAAALQTASASVAAPLIPKMTLLSASLSSMPPSGTEYSGTPTTMALPSSYCDGFDHISTIA